MHNILTQNTTPILHRKPYKDISKKTGFCQFYLYLFKTAVSSPVRIHSWYEKEACDSNNCQAGALRNSASY